MQQRRSLFFDSPVSVVWKSAVFPHPNIWLASLLCLLQYEMVLKGGKQKESW